MFIRLGGSCPCPFDSKAHMEEEYESGHLDWFEIESQSKMSGLYKKKPPGKERSITLNIHPQYAAVINRKLRIKSTMSYKGMQTGDRLAVSR